MLLAPEVHWFVLRMTPLLVLYLGASEARDPLRAASLMSVVLVGKRLVTPLRPDRQGIGPAYTRLLSYRTHDDVWVTMLDELLDLAPLIVIDIRSDTDAVSFELDRIALRTLRGAARWERSGFQAEWTIEQEELAADASRDPRMSQTSGLGRSSVEGHKVETAAATLSSQRTTEQGRMK